MFREQMPEEMYAEYQDAMANAEEDVLNGVTLKGARRAFEVTPIGTKLSFETTDLNGNVVSSADLFAGHKVTMINLWADQSLGDLVHHLQAGDAGTGRTQ